MPFGAVLLPQMLMRTPVPLFFGGGAFRSVQSVSSTAMVRLFSMKISCTKLSDPKSHSDAIPFSECQNCSNVPCCICFLERNLGRFRIRFRFTSNVSLQLSIRSFNDHSAFLANGYLSVKVFFRCGTQRKVKDAAYFFSATGWSRLLSRALFSQFRLRVFSMLLQ